MSESARLKIRAAFAQAPCLRGPYRHLDRETYTLRGFAMLFSNDLLQKCNKNSPRLGAGVFISLLEKGLGRLGGSFSSGMERRLQIENSLRK
jgi:hypothetical protein